jgi:peptide/nickel transport system substrate-binding protein
MDAPLPKNKRRYSLAQFYFSFVDRRKLSDKVLFNIALLAVGFSVLGAIFTANTLFTQTFPTSGGAIVEGIVGTPRFVNPVIAINRADHDMVALIYSGLLRLDENGILVPDLAESVTRSQDGKTYTIKLRNDNRFHNGQQVQARDVVFTIGLIQNPDLKSPLRGAWDGVIVEEVSEYELTITIPEAYTPFTENLTVGILPRDLWDSLPIEQIPFSQNNTEPVGSGPYKVKEVLRNKSGLIDGYTLEVFEGARKSPKITTLNFTFFQDEDALLEALSKKEITSTPSVSVSNLGQIDLDTYQIVEAPLPRTFGIYFNQNKSTALRDSSARKALEAAIDTGALVEKVLFGYGTATDSPIPPGFLDTPDTQTASGSIDHIEKAQSILRDGGWTKNDSGFWEKKIDENNVTLRVSLATANTPLFDQTATAVGEVWKSIGVDVSASQFEQTDLVQSVIRPRDFEALLYGADIGRSVDLYPFWHSSQKNDPGLNIAQYTNIEVDALLRKLKTAQDTATQMEYITQIEQKIQNDTPAIFLFVPTFTYIVDKEVQGINFTGVSRQSERFANIANWHMRSSKVWPIFSNN